MDAYKAIKGQYFKPKTERVRAATDKKERGRLKQALPYVTFSGTFHPKRGNGYLKKHSNLICMDIDGLPPDALPDARKALLSDSECETAMLFVSPSGNGIKWVLEIEGANAGNHLEWFKAIKYHMESKHGLQTDDACKDVARSCFLCHDEEIFLNPKFLDNA